MLGKLLAVWSERQHVRKVQVMDCKVCQNMSSSL